MNKKIDVSVLPDNFLVEIQIGGISQWRIVKFHEVESFSSVTGIRPALDIWHFNNGLMVLPDGLVIEAYHLDGFKYKTCTPYRLERDFEDPLDATIAVKIIGVTADNEIDGKRLDLEVIEL